MIVIKSDKEIDLMRISGRITAGSMEAAKSVIKPGITTKEIDLVVYEYILSKGAKPSFLGYGGFAGSACISVNEELIHGIPGNRVIKNGDIVSIDVGAFYKGFHTDMADTILVGDVSNIAKALYDATKQSFFEGFKFMKVGYRLGDVSSAIQNYAEGKGFSVVKKFVGHGVGFDLHEDPSIPNYGTAGRGVRLQKGMTIAVEPMINEGTDDVLTLDNGWTVVTVDGKLSAHYENTVFITDNEPEILTVI